MNDLLKIQGLCKRYGDFALRDVDLAVPAGAVVGLVGSNGAGKTTVIKSLLGLVRPDAGSIHMLGCDVLGSTPKEAARARQGVGAVFDTCPFPKGFSVRDAGATMAAVYEGWDGARFERCLDLFGLPARQKVEKLSRGMGMKLSLACALSHDAQLLVLDEATAGLDPLAREEMLGILRGYLAEQEDRGVLMATHITSDLERVADYVVCIDGGRMVFSLEKDRITEDAAVARCRQAQFEELAASGFFAPGELRFARNAYGIDVLVPDRAAFAREFASVALDRATIEAYMALAIKGEKR